MQINTMEQLRVAIEHTAKKIIGGLDGGGVVPFDVADANLCLMALAFLDVAAVVHTDGDVQEEKSFGFVDFGKTRH